MKILGLKINMYEVIGLIIALSVAILAFIFLQDQINLFYFVLGICFIVGGFPFFIFLIIEGRTNKEIDEMFLEFSRNLVESVRSGTPISKSILNIQKKDYGKLSPYINKLGNQISIGIPVKTALETFARDVGSKTVSRAVTIISESEKAGGQIEDILNSVVKSVTQIEKLKKEREAALYSLVVQGYIIFLIFIVIMLVMQFAVLPIATEFSGDVVGEEDISGDLGGSFSKIFGSTESKATPEEMARPFIWLLIAQGLFVGLVVGKLSEGSIRAGLKHSFVLVILAILSSTGAKLFFG